MTLGNRRQFRWMALSLAALCLSALAERGGAQTQRANTGRFQPYNDSVANQSHQAVATRLVRSGFMQKLTDDLNRKIALPCNIPFGFAELRMANAYYRPDQRRIVIGYELVEQIQSDMHLVFSALKADPKWNLPQIKEEDYREIEWQATLCTVRFICLHELGHCLIDVLDLNAVGNEEDAADQLATVLLLNGDDWNENGAWLNAMYMRTEVILGRDTTPFWNEHPLNMQRYYNLMAAMYGKDPKKYNFAANGGLPPERAARAEYDYKKIERHWIGLLQHYLKSGSIAASTLAVPDTRPPTGIGINVKDGLSNANGWGQVREDAEVTVGGVTKRFTLTMQNRTVSLPFNLADHSAAYTIRCTVTFNNADPDHPGQLTRRNYSGQGTLDANTALNWSVNGDANTGQLRLEPQ